MCPQLNTAKFHFQSQEGTPIPNILYNFISGGEGHDQRAGSGTPMGRLHSLSNVIIVKSTTLPDPHPETDSTHRGPWALWVYWTFEHGPQNSHI